jgi:DNA-binding response OmpR family regulator
MDVSLKGNIDGIDAAREIGVRWDIPIIYLTALTDEETLRRAETTGPYYGCIVKPFDERELQTLIENTLSQKREQQA